MNPTAQPGLAGNSNRLVVLPDSATVADEKLPASVDAAMWILKHRPPGPDSERAHIAALRTVAVFFEKLAADVDSNKTR
jgi:hypothetical protein